MANFDRAIEAIIQKGMAEGAFDNLAGKGKPLDLRENPFVDKDWQMAFHILEQQGFALPWMDARNSIEQEFQIAQQNLTRTWQWRCEQLADGEDVGLVEEEWRRAVSRFTEKVTALNKRIDDYNLLIPADVFYRPRINGEKEIAAIQG